MITCKEDLVNTYIENDNGVLRDVYVSLLSIFDFKWAEGQKADKYKNLEGFIMVDVDSDIGTRSKKLFFSTERPGIKQLTLTDLLPTSYENTKVYSLDEDVIRKYAELCGVEYNHGTIPATGEYVGVSWVMDEPDDVARFTDDSDVALGEYSTATLTTEQILAAWDLRFGDTKTRTKVEYVKCEFDKLSDLVLFVESENKLYTKGCDFCEVGGMHDAIRRYGLSQQLYRRTEIEISERDLFIEEIGKLIPEFDKRTNKLWIGKIYDSGKFKLID